MPNTSNIPFSQMLQTATLIDQIISTWAPQQVEDWATTNPQSVEFVFNDYGYCLITHPEFSLASPEDQQAARDVFASHLSNFGSFVEPDTMGTVMFELAEGDNLEVLDLVTDHITPAQISAIAASDPDLLGNTLNEIINITDYLFRFEFVNVGLFGQIFMQVPVPPEEQALVEAAVQDFMEVAGTYINAEQLALPLALLSFTENTEVITDFITTEQWGELLFEGVDLGFEAGHNFTFLDFMTDIITPDVLVDISASDPDLLGNVLNELINVETYLVEIPNGNVGIIIPTPEQRAAIEDAVADFVAVAGEYINASQLIDPLLLLAGFDRTDVITDNISAGKLGEVLLDASLDSFYMGEFYDEFEALIGFITPEQLESIAAADPEVLGTITENLIDRAPQEMLSEFLEKAAEFITGDQMAAALIQSVNAYDFDFFQRLDILTDFVNEDHLQTLSVTQPDFADTLLLYTAATQIYWVNFIAGTRFPFPVPEEILADGVTDVMETFGNFVGAETVETVLNGMANTIFGINGEAIDGIVNNMADDHFAQVDFSQLEAQDIFIGTNGNDGIYTYLDPVGGAHLFGGNGNDSLVSSNDALNGDELYGGNGTDFLLGLGGDDLLSGGDGVDTLIGGTGADTFVFNQGETGVDLIQGFSTAEGDLLDLSDYLTGFDPLQHAIEDFVILTESGNSTTVSVDVDGQGEAAAVDVTSLSGATGLTVDDVIDTSALV